MLNKLSISVASCMALAVMMGFSASALAVVDPSCDGDPYYNTIAVHDFAIETPDSNVAHQVSGVSGTGLVCGTRIRGSLFMPEGLGSMNRRAVIANPPGVTVNAVPSDDIPDGSYVGSSVINVAGFLCGTSGDACIKEDQPITLRADSSLFCPADALACYNGIDGSGLGNTWIWVEEDAEGRTALTIGPFHTAFEVYFALTHIKSFDLCAYAGAVGGTECGDGSDPSKWMQKNGDVSEGIGYLPGYTPGISIPTSLRPVLLSCKYGKNKGRGIYTVTATNRDGQTTDPVSSCVSWTP